MRGFTYEDLAKELNEAGIWKFVSGYQKVDFNRRIALVIEDNKIRDFLVERGLKVNGIHVTFAYHRRRDPLTRVYVSKLPIGILPAFAFFGDISKVNSITKIMQGRRVDIGRYGRYVKHKRNDPVCGPWDSRGDEKMQFLFLLLLP